MDSSIEKSLSVEFSQEMSCGYCSEYIHKIIH